MWRCTVAGPLDPSPVPGERLLEHQQRRQGMGLRPRDTPRAPRLPKRRRGQRQTLQAQQGPGSAWRHAEFPAGVVVEAPVPEIPEQKNCGGNSRSPTPRCRRECRSVGQERRSGRCRLIAAMSQMGRTSIPDRSAVRRELELRPAPTSRSGRRRRPAACSCSRGPAGPRSPWQRASRFRRPRRGGRRGPE